MKGKLAYFNGPGDIELREYPIPDPAPGAILTKVSRSNVCGSDLHIWQGNHPLIKSDMALGHETVARIDALGAGVDKDYAGDPVKEGDRIAPAFYLTCMKCPACLRSKFNLCHNANNHMITHPDNPPHFFGTMATHYYVHPNQFFYKVPDKVTDALASSANCAMSQVYFALDRSQLKAGETLVIQGAGGLGLHATAIAHAAGATVIIIDGVAKRLQLAEEFGASYTINLNEYKTVEQRVDRVKEITGGEGADVGMEVVGAADAFGEGIHLVCPGGRYLVVGIINPELLTTFSPGHIARKNLTVHGVVRYDPWYLHKSLTFLEKYADKYPYRKFSEKVYSLDEVVTAFEDSTNRLVARAAIEP